MRAILILLLLTCSMQAVVAQQFQIIDKNSSGPVPYANVYFPELHTGLASDSTGSFSIDQMPDNLDIQISSIGFKTLILKLKDLQVGQPIELEEAHMDIKEVLVAAASSKLSGQSAMNIVGMDLKDATVSSGLSLAENLSTIPGIQQTGTGPGIGKPTIRGLSGNRVAVFSQGVRVENQQWGAEHGLGLDANGYEHVEVIKGPATLLYGSDALGGVLYFVDDRYAAKNTIEAELGSVFHSNTLGTRNNMNFKLSKDDWHWNVFGSYTNHQDYTDGAMRVVPNSRFNTMDVKTSIGHSSGNWLGAIRYDFLNEHYGLTEISPDSLPEQIGIFGRPRRPDHPYQSLQTHLASLENTIFINGGSLKLNIGFVSNRRREFEASSDSPLPTSAADRASLDMMLNTLSYTAKWNTPIDNSSWDIIIGGQGMYQWNTNNGSEVLIPDASTFDIGTFAVANWHYTKRSFLQLGVRYDLRNLKSQADTTGHQIGLSRMFHAFNFSTGINQRLSGPLRLRVTIASGFRAPNSFELLSNGQHNGAFRYEIGNRSLRNEVAYQIDLALNYSADHLEIYVNPFMNYLRNFIYLQPSDSLVDQVPVYLYKQQNAMLFGGESGVHFHPHSLHWLHIELNYSNVFSRDEQGRPLPLIPSQKLTSEVRTDFAFNGTIKHFSAYIKHIYSFAQHDVVDFEMSTPEYHLLNAGVSLDLSIGRQPLSVSLGVSNILNRTYYDHLSRYKTQGIDNMGRNFTVSLKIPFSHSLPKSE